MVLVFGMLGGRLRHGPEWAASTHRSHHRTARRRCHHRRQLPEADPLAVSLPRSSAYQINLEKDPFGRGLALRLPSATQCEQRLLRWGLDYPSGVSNSLTPERLALQLRPEVLPSRLPPDLFAEMTVT